MTTEPLTPREREVVRLLAETGGSDKHIAARLGIGPRTAETHLQNIRRKLGVRTRAQLVAWWFQTQREAA